MLENGTAALVPCFCMDWFISERMKEKKHCPGLTEFLLVFRVLYNNLHDKVQGKGCSHILAIIETKEASIQFISSLVVPYHLCHCQFNPFWGRRDFVHLGARAYILKLAYAVCHFTGTFIPESHLPKWLHFTKLVGKKKPWYSSTTFLWTGWLKWCLWETAE